MWLGNKLLYLLTNAKVPVEQRTVLSTKKSAGYSLLPSKTSWLCENYVRFRSSLKTHANFAQIDGCSWFPWNYVRFRSSLETPFKFCDASCVFIIYHGMAWNLACVVSVNQILFMYLLLALSPKKCLSLTNINKYEDRRIDWSNNRNRVGTLWYCFHCSLWK